MANRRLPTNFQLNIFIIDARVTLLQSLKQESVFSDLFLFGEICKHSIRKVIFIYAQYKQATQEFFVHHCKSHD